VSPADKLREACGVMGVIAAPGADGVTDVAPLVYRGLLALQHRGQESAGIAVARPGGGGGGGAGIECRKGMGLVTQVFAGGLDDLAGPAAVGHVRYSTHGSSVVINAQPFVSRFKLGSIAVVHNGTLTNADVVRELLEDGGVGFTSSSDSEVILNLLARNFRKGVERAVIDTIQSIKGSYALAVLIGAAGSGAVLVGARDPNGIRPLCLGRIPSGWILASESCAIDAAGGETLRDVEPGEIVIIDRDGPRSIGAREKTPRAVCAFEYVYFARADSVIDGRDVYGTRIRAGEILAREAAVEADVVVGIPDSGVTAAIGYGRATGTPFGVGIVKSKYVGRTFIAPDQRQREWAVSVKHNVIAAEVRGRRVVVIDDSIVRGTTMRRLVEAFRAAGAREVHIRVSSPPVRCPCYFGIDTPHRKDLISNGASVDEVRRSLGADSLAFISVGGLLESLGGEGFCLGCFTGEYPAPAPGEGG